jgi:hypothetical protein
MKYCIVRSPHSHYYSTKSNVIDRINHLVEGLKNVERNNYLSDIEKQGLTQHINDFNAYKTKVNNMPIRDFIKNNKKIEDELKTLAENMFGTFGIGSGLSFHKNGVSVFKHSL